ncbi:farnesyl pyrophosphate synthase-like protein, partial [Leptotrombidium deliense]
VERIILRISELFEAKNDFLDCFDDFGSNRINVKEGKCCWIAVQALQRMTNEQKVTFESNYGICNEICEKKIREIYEKLNMRNVFIEFEKLENIDIKEQIVMFANQSKIDVSPFFFLLDPINKITH